MSRKLSLRDFGAGTVLGLVLGTSGLAAAAMGYDIWTKSSQEYRIGYVAGFMQMANLARNLDPGGYVDIRYPLVLAKPVEFASKIDELYKDPEYRDYSINSMLQAVSHELEKKYGKIPPEERMRRRMVTQLEIVKKKREAQAKAAGKEAPAPPKVVQAPKQFVPPVKKKAPETRKWCRCDGRNPKAERAKRRAVRAEAEEAAKAAGKDPVAAGKAAVAELKAANAAAARKATPAAAPEPAKQPPTAPAKP